MQNSLNYGATLAEAKQHLADRVQFHTGTLNGAWETFSGDKFYVVRSYGTAIAWLADGIKPEVFSSAYTHSTTTTKHANLVKKAWGI